MRPGTLALALLIVLAGLVVITSTTVVSPARAEAPAGGQFVPLNGKLMDTRPAYQVGPYGTPMPADTWRSITVAGALGVPSSDVTAVAVNLQVVNPSVGGLVRARPTGGTEGVAVSYLNYPAGEITTNSATLQVGASGGIDVKTSGSADLLIVLLGYYTEGEVGAGSYVPITPKRIHDSRTPTPVGGSSTGIMAPDALRTFNTTANATGVPTNASAAVLNVVVVSPTADGRFDTRANGVSSGSSKSFDSSAIATSFGVITSLTSANFDLVMRSASAHVVVDVLGYFAPDHQGGGFVPAKARALDTRGAPPGTPATPIAANGTRQVNISNALGTPPGQMKAVVVNLTVPNPAAGGLLNAYRSDQPAPSTTALNFSTGRTVSNSVIVAVSTNGTITIAHQGASATHVIVDVEGYFSPGVPSSLAALYSATTPAPECVDVCVPIDPVTVFADRLNADQTQQADLTVIPSINDVSNVRFKLTATTESGVAKVRVFRPGLPVMPMAVTGAFNTTTGTSITGEVGVGDFNTIAIHVSDSAANVTIQVTGLTLFPNDAVEEGEVDNDDLLELEIDPAESTGIVPERVLTKDEQDELTAASPASTSTSDENPRTLRVDDQAFVCENADSSQNQTDPDITDISCARELADSGGDDELRASGETCSIHLGWVANRYFTCRYENWISRHIECIRSTGSCTEKGTARFRVFLYARMSRLSGTVSAYIDVQWRSGTGTLITGAEGLTWMKCSGCQGDTIESGAYVVSAGRPTDRTMKDFTVLHSGDAQDLKKFPALTFKFQPIVRGKHKRWQTRVAPTIRCDSMRPFQNRGCIVFHSPRPVFYMSTNGSAPQSAAHVKRAIQAGFPSILTRYYWYGRRNLNRNYAKQLCRESQFQLSCDEYPYASTREGCWWANYYCSVDDIPVADNKKGGSLLGSFYAQYRIIPGDAFQQKVN